VRATLALVVTCLALVPAVAAADDLSHISDEELSEEIDARDGDIARTAKRIDTLELEELELAVSLDEARTQLEEIDRRLTRRVALLYRLTRHGAALRYLLSAGSATELLKRLKTLQRLVLEGLDDRRQAGVRAADVEERMRAVSLERRQADEMLEQLEAARDELRAERARRRG